ncbi:MAG: hypothetical protein K9J81_01405 [Desulfohalobiaceae bacterium]|nr:hypothetical protein [Desulfohalobiaceae bacterium]
MSADSSFQAWRVLRLIRNTLVLQRTAIVVQASAAAGILLLLSLADAMLLCRPELHQRLYLVVLFAGGLLLTSRSFKDLHDPVQGTFWLLLPASLPEKTLSRVLLTTVVFVAGSLLGYWAFSLLAEGCNWLIFQRRHQLFVPFAPGVLKGALAYTALQAPFLLGAVTFRRHALSKTILSLLGLVLLLGLAGLLGLRLLFWDQLEGSGLRAMLTGPESRLVWMRLTESGRTVAWIGRIVFWLLMPPLCWVLCWVRQKRVGP